MEAEKSEVEGREKRKYNLFRIALVLLIIFALGVRLYFFFQYKDQPVWWDESEHVLMAKHIAFGTPTTGWNVTREILLPLVYAFFFKLFNSEVIVRFVQVMISFAAVLLTYFVGKEIFDKKIGLLAALGMAVFAEFMFWSVRFGLEPLGIALMLASILFFWKGYMKKQREKIFLPLAGAFAALSVMASAKEGLVVFAVFLFLLFTDSLKFLKNKYVWLGIIVALLVSAPFMVYYYKTVGHPLPRLKTQAESTFVVAPQLGWSWSNFFQFTKYFDNYLGLAFLFTFLLGIAYIILTFVVGFDLIGKEGKDNDEIKKYILLLFWILLPLFAFSYFMGHDPSAYLDPRMILETFPAVFMIVALGLNKIYDFIAQYKKELAYIVLAFVLIYAAYTQLKVASIMVDSRSNSFAEVKDAALFIKQNSNATDIVFSASSPQTTYYSERQVEGYPERKIDFERRILEVKPRYMIVSVFEKHPEYVYSWAESEKKAVKSVRAYFRQQGEQQTPLLIVYEFISYEF